MTPPGGQRPGGAGDAGSGRSIGAALCGAGQVLRQAGIEQPRREARWLLSHALGLDVGALLAAAERPLDDAAAATRFDAMLARRAAREPFDYIVGRAPFRGLEFGVSPATLIPRADSEVLVEAALDHVPEPGRVLDLGTGTGCLLLSVLHAAPGARGVGVDLVPEAAALAGRNAAALGLADRASFFAGDWADAIIGAEEFDLVLCNPPYVERAAIPGLMPEVAGYEPGTALDGGPDGLDAYRALFKRLPGLLGPFGVAVVEVGFGQSGAVGGLMWRHGLEWVDCRRDMGGVARAIVMMRE